MLHALLLVTLAQFFTPDGVPVPESTILTEPATAWVAPGRLFAIKVPSGWGIALHDNDPYTIDFRAMTRPGNGVLQVRRITVPTGANPRQLMLNAIETRLGKLPNFKVASRRNVQVAGHKAAAVVGSYAYQGNLQFPVALEEVYVVTGGEAFIFHFECFEPAAPELANDVNVFYSSFQPRPPGLENDPFAPSQPAMPNNVNPDQVRF
jgi:hypothetical protein